MLYTDWLYLTRSKGLGYTGRAGRLAAFRRLMGARS
jgi:hypothetical protein